MQGGVDLRAVEGGEGGRRPPAHRRLVGQRGQHGREAGPVPDGAQRGDGRLPAQRIGMSSPGCGQRAQGGNSSPLAPLAEGPRRHLHHRGVGVREGRGHSDVGGPRRQLTGSATHPGVGVGEPPCEFPVGEPPESGERTEGTGAHPGGLVGESGPGPGDVAHVPGEHHGASARGDAVAGRFRGRLHRTTMTDDQSTHGAEDDLLSLDQAPTSVGAGTGGQDATEPGSTRRERREERDRRRSVGRRRRWWPWAVFVTAVLIVAIASRVNLPYYAIQPGTAQSVAQFITVPKDQAHPVTRPVLLTDVEEARVTALSYLYFKLQSDTALYPQGAVTGGTPPSQLEAQGVLEMSQAEDAAKVSALRYLGYQVPATPAGAVIFGTFPGTPAYGVLHVGDVITAVDLVPTPTAQDLTHQLSLHQSGQRVTFTVRRGGTGPPTPVGLTLRRTTVDIGGQPATLDVGIEPMDQVDHTYPFPIAINVTNIGGPSAGLAMTLGVIDALTSGSLTGGRTVAATGTMDGHGNVGDVGGVAQKTVAVENAGATLFLVPPGEYKDALSKDRPGLAVVAVSTLAQALQAIAAHGGHLPAKVPTNAGVPAAATAAG